MENETPNIFEGVENIEDSPYKERREAEARYKENIKEQRANSSSVSSGPNTLSPAAHRFGDIGKQIKKELQENRTAAQQAAHRLRWGQFLKAMGKLPADQFH